MSTVKESKEREKPCSTCLPTLRWACMVEAVVCWVDPFKQGLGPTSRECAQQTVSSCQLHPGGLSCRELHWLRSCPILAVYIWPLNGGKGCKKGLPFGKMCGNPAWHFSSKSSPWVSQGFAKPPLQSSVYQWSIFHPQVSLLINNVYHKLCLSISFREPDLQLNASYFPKKGRLTLCTLSVRQFTQS